MVRRGLCVGVMSVWLVVSGPLWAQEAPQAPSMELQAGLLQEAEALEGAAKYADAAKRYDEIVKRHPNHEVGPRAAVGAVRAWIAAGKIKKAEASAKQALKQYGKAQLEAVLAAQMLVAAAHYDAKKRDVAAVKAWSGQTLKQFEQAGGKAGHPAAPHAAHAAFLLAELERDVWLALKAANAKTATIRDHTAQLTKGIGDLRGRYERVLLFGATPWLWAALYRRAELYEQFVQAMHAAPTPFAPESEDEVHYKQAMTTQLAPILKKAQEEYQQLVTNAEQHSAGDDVWVARARERHAALSEAKP